MQCVIYAVSIVSWKGHEEMHFWLELEVLESSLWPGSQPSSHHLRCFRFSCGKDILYRYLLYMMILCQPFCYRTPFSELLYLCPTPKEKKKFWEEQKCFHLFIRTSSDYNLIIIQISRKSKNLMVA